MPAVIQVADATVRDASKLLTSSGSLTFGQGVIATILAIVLSFLCLLAVLAFRFPQYLTTPELRHLYSPDAMRRILFVCLLASGALGLTNVMLDNRRRLNGLAFATVILAVALGGSRVPVGDFPDHTPYVGLDWFILDLLASTTVFVLLEKLFPLYRKQPVFREDWQTDMVHFAFNHFIVGLVLLMVNFLVHRVFGWLVNAGFQQAVQHIWFVPQLLLCMLVADLMEYATHRAYHEVPFLWRFHAVHHSVRTMDWLAGSRQHILELVCTRVCVLGPLFVLGFDQAVLDTYIIIVGFQAVFNHANVHLPWGPLKYVLVTPDFHHWHHSSEDEAIDRNYAAHFAFIDDLFGTAVKSSKQFPQEYGVVGDYVPDGFIRQQRFPFRRR
ncbi:sterol desaturase family protein [Paraburkholderia nemoris]|uniref:sterol desaturase family protein n=1 Tax=Paraburkholderia nemoris TaxID=2793076 RepID=UPI0038B3F682